MQKVAKFLLSTNQNTTFFFFSFNLRSEVTVMSWGGKYQSVQKSALGDSYTQQSGTQINWISWSDNPTLKIKDIIKKDTKNLSVDILDLLIGSRFSLNEIETNCENGALYKFDLKILSLNNYYNMIIPVRCFTCGEVLADKWVPYIKCIQTDKSQSDSELVPESSDL